MYTQISNHYITHVKLIECNYTSVKKKKKNSGHYQELENVKAGSKLGSQPSLITHKKSTAGLSLVGKDAGRAPSSL